MAAEKNFENKIKGFLKDHGCWFLKYWGGAAYTKSGIPDILACCEGFFLGIEVKRKMTFGLVSIQIIMTSTY